MARVILFSLHAKRQLKEREISDVVVRNVLLRPAQIVNSYGGRKIAQDIVRHKGEKFLMRIIFEEIDGELKIITVYLTTRIEKYWRKENED